jgi:hypothetical protein
MDNPRSKLQRDVERSCFDAAQKEAKKRRFAPNYQGLAREANGVLGAIISDAADMPPLSVPTLSMPSTTASRHELYEGSSMFHSLSLAAPRPDVHNLIAIRSAPSTVQPVAELPGRTTSGLWSNGPYQAAVLGDTAGGAHETAGVLRKLRVLRALQDEDAKIRYLLVLGQVKPPEQDPHLARLAAMFNTQKERTNLAAAFLSPSRFPDNRLQDLPMASHVGMRFNPASTFRLPEAGSDAGIARKVTTDEVLLRSLKAEQGMPSLMACRPDNEDSRMTGVASLPRVSAGLQGSQDITPLGIEEDTNWLSEMQCFLRSEIVEVFRAGKSKSQGTTITDVSTQQVGIRCRWCVDVPSESRACRSSALPSSLRQLYQSFTMMVRDHFGPNTMCQAIPAHLRQRLNYLRCSRISQGASASKHYWIYAAQKIGMVDTAQEGIQITQDSIAAGLQMPCFLSPMADAASACQKPAPTVLLVQPQDLSKASTFLYTLLLQTEVVRLQPSERTAKRKTLPVGLEGIGCRHCCTAGRFGFSRRFPLRRRCLPDEVEDVHRHIMRCNLCPKEVKELLEKLHVEHEAALSQAGKNGHDTDPHREFFDLLWARLGRKEDVKT